MDKILSKINKTSKCWLWTGYINNNGYGEAHFNGRKYKTHRLIYELHKGVIPKELEIDHLCRVRNCVNPDHLEVVTHLENIKRAQPFISINKRTHCKKGHEYSEENTWLVTRGNGRTNRVCRICKSNIMKNNRASKRIQCISQQKI